VATTEIWTFAYRWVGHGILQTTLLHVSSHTKSWANQFSDCRRTNSCQILNERVCEVIPHLWLSWPSTCMFLGFVPYMLLFDLHEEIVRPVHTSYSFRAQCNHWQNKPCTKGDFRPWAQSPGPQHQHKGHKCLIDLIAIGEPGQISFKDGVQVSRTIICDPAITSNDAPHNLSCYWMQQSLNRSLYHHTRLQPLLKGRNWPHQ